MRRTGAVLLALAAALALAGGAQAGKVRNGGFERGDLRGWQVRALPDAECGSWTVYGGDAVPGLPSPPRGDRAAAASPPAECLSGAHILSRVVKLKKGSKHKLSFRLAYDNGYEFFLTPGSLEPEPAGSQQIRVDVLRAGAPLLSVNPNHILKRVYVTRHDAPLRRGYRRVTANLSKLAGKRVRLRFAAVANRGPLAVGLDAVRIASRKR
ncbi:MAG TPA: hypothetical protein VIL04_03490 [Solirubrobacterales bacterium]